MKKICLKLFSLQKIDKNKSFIKKQPSEGFFKRVFLKNSTKLTWRRLCWSLFLNKVSDLWPTTFKKEIPTQVFSGEFCEFLRSSFLQSTSRRLLLFVICLTVSFCKEVLYNICSNLLLLEKSTKTHNFAIFSFCKYILYSVLWKYFKDQNINTRNHISLMR